MTRAVFYPKALQYLFSIDLEFAELAPIDDAGPSTLATRCAIGEERPLGAVYHALGEAQVNGRDVLDGGVRMVRERLSFDAVEAMGEVEARLVIETRDRFGIHAEIHGVFRAPTGRSALTMFDPLDGYLGGIDAIEDDPSRVPLETRAFVSARFDTGAAKYRWLSNTQCVGYGRIQIVNGRASRATFDIYAMQ